MEFQDYASVTSEFSMTRSSPAPVDAVPTQGMFQFPNLTIENNNRRNRLIEQMEGEEESQSHHSEGIEQ
ncbi:Hypothetical predicted protein [Mytilus galloprovincialis]|uniref:Uncharacterized protein n=1 Tax=Mytilus galloprovincialis TaxID=29158 RepID=A0A8B6HH17_MYTGA|nr:Hypothetical predicted protein [Mytilus galloprovincialis]